MSKVQSDQTVRLGQTETMRLVQGSSGGDRYACKAVIDYMWLRLSIWNFFMPQLETKLSLFMAFGTNSLT